MKLLRLLLLPLTAYLAFGQQVNQDENSTQWSPVSLAGEFLEHDYVNWFAYANGVYDTYAPISTNGVVSNAGSFGWEVGGGANISHRLRHGQFSLSYRGDFRDYQNSYYTSGTDQGIGIGFVKQFSRKWSFSASVNGGMSLYGNAFFTNPNTGALPILQSDPFGTESKYLATGLALTYQQSRRLSYVVAGSYFLQRYTAPGSIGAEGVSGSGSLYYRTTARTTIGATYSHSYYTFQRNAGVSNADSVQGSVSHAFPNHWGASLYAGFTRSNTAGTTLLPLSDFGFTNLPGLYVEEKYNQTTTFPSFAGTVSRNFHHSTFYVSGGEGLTPGNGYYLASKTLYAGGLYSIAIQRRQNVSFSGGLSRLSSVANAVGVNYSSSYLTAAYGINLVKFFGLNARYDYLHFGSLSPNPSVNDNRLSFGINFSSKSIPLTLF